ncbi:tetratricopeptide repeat protein 4-like isoform X2 [Dysidea avara]|uniref:tetratricopeptide repeat protein 4-like isoform X2 n=1 Tax=Dysidea avara TaxID=196820 RepID=UPI003327A2DD
MAGNQPPGGASLDIDAMIDEVIARKGPHRYTDGLHEDKWEEEIEQIPLFMNKPLEEVDLNENPAAAAFQQIKFEEETPEGRAKVHKEEGNDLFKKKKYREAVVEYTEGIKQKSSDVTMNTVLYCNRATAQFYLGNYRSSVNDAVKSRELDSYHIKAYVRGASGCVEISSYTEAIEWCDSGLQVEPTNQKLQELRKKAVTLKKKQDRDVRKGHMEEKNKQKEEEELIAIIKSRGVCLSHDTLLSPCQPAGGRVHINTNGEIVWPVLFVYPEHGQSDYIVAFNENNRFIDHLHTMFAEPTGWDVDHNYSPDHLEAHRGGRHSNIHSVIKRHIIQGSFSQSTWSDSN